MDDIRAHQRQAVNKPYRTQAILKIIGFLKMVLDIIRYCTFETQHLTIYQSD